MSKFIEQLHRKLSPIQTQRDSTFREDLIDVLFSPAYGWGVMKFEGRNFYRKRIKNRTHAVLKWGILTSAALWTLFMLLQYNA